MAFKTLISAPKTTDEVLAAFRKTLDQLKVVVEAHCAIADRKDDEAIKAKYDADTARREAGKANKALARLEAVFGEAA